MKSSNLFQPAPRRTKEELKRELYTWQDEKLNAMKAKYPGQEKYTDPAITAGMDAIQEKADAILDALPDMMCQEQYDAALEEQRKLTEDYIAEGVRVMETAPASAFRPAAPPAPTNS